MSLAIGVDVGGTNLRAALVDEQGDVVRAARHRLSARDPASVLDAMEMLIADLEPERPDLPMAVGLAALIRLRTGVVALSPNLGWRDVPFGGMLAERFGRKIRLVNDLDAIAVGEAACGAGKGTCDVVCVFVGTGVGMGAVVHGRVLEGHNGIATELGHIKIHSVKTGRLCGCGERGCLEAYTSGYHLPELLAEKVCEGVTSRLMHEVGGELGKLDAGRIEVAARDGDPAAVALWIDVAARLGRAIGNLVTVFNPAVLVLGGGVLAAAPSLRAQLLEQIRTHAGRLHLEDLELRESQLGDSAGLVGAGILAHQGRAAGCA